jgi:hypothetical protein
MSALVAVVLSLVLVLVLVLVLMLVLVLVLVLVMVIVMVLVAMMVERSVPFAPTISQSFPICARRLALSQRAASCVHAASTPAHASHLSFQRPAHTGCY